MIVVVGGQARKVGKTKAVCDIIGATKSVGWVAAKLTAHTHETPGGSGTTDTDRYLVAGAREALLLPSAADLPAATNLIIESNAAVEHLTPDLFVFVTDDRSPEWKDSARRVFNRADIVVNREIPPDTLRQIAARLLGV